MNDRQKFDLSELINHLASDHQDFEEPDLSGGKRVVFVVDRIRGRLVDSHAVLDPADKSSLPADRLAQLLAVDVGSLLGIRYSCRVIPAEHGKFRTDYQLEGSGNTTAS